MSKFPSQFSLLVFALSLALNACGSAGADTQDEPVAEDPGFTVQPPTATQVEPSPTVPATSTFTPTIEPSPTPTQVARISVFENTNCRSGPGSEYLFQGVLAIGEYAEIRARNPEGDYWYVTGADLPAEGCWLWGELAQIDGEVSGLPIITPAPSPTPQVGFKVYIKQFIDCGYQKQVVFAIQNIGGERIWSGYVEVQEFGTQETLYKARERHPFAAYVTPACPPDHGNELWPGETRYIHVPYDSEIEGITVVGILTLCTADHQGGTCLTEYSYFGLP